jgi:DNA uptake protein ComE-like DNA-binding protein
MAFFWVLPNWYPEKIKLPETTGWKLQQVDSAKILVKESNRHFETPPSNFSLKLFEFNPNELPAEGWKKLGLRDKTIQTILHYREKGGWFREPGDLKKIWGLSLEEANKLIPFVAIPKLEKPILNQPIDLPKLMPASILINQATMAELLLIPGINKSLAARMIKFRDKLGGFKNIEQIRKTYGLSDSLFQLMAPLVVL